MIASQFLYSQTYNFEYYNVEEGLSQSRVNSIIQDDRGHLWVGTQGGGVCKFDGSKFTQYSEKDGVSGDIVTGLTVDKKGNIWITSTWGGVTKYDGRKFLIFSKKDGLLNENGNNVVFTDNSGKIWIGSGLGIVTYENGTFKKLTKENNKLNGNIINCINEDKKGNIWVGTNNGITIITKKESIFISQKDGLLSNNTTAIEEDFDGNIFIGSKKGLTKILAGSIDNHKEFQYNHSLLDGVIISVTDIIKDKEKNLWIATEKNGAYVLNANKTTNHITKKNGLITNSLTTLFLDRSGNLWIGTNGAGLIKFGNKAFTYFNKIPGLNSPSIFSITEDLNDNIWITTNDEGVFKYDGTTSTQYTINSGFKSKNVRSSLLDKHGNLWFATTNGLTRLKNGVFKTFTTNDGLPSNDTRSLLLDNEGNLWIGTYGKGLSKYDYSSFRNFTTKDGLSHDYIHVLFQDSENNIWIGTGNGATKYKNGKFTSLAGAKGFCNSYIGSITEDKFGQVWFGTDRCAVRYDGLDFKPITIKDGLSSGVIYFMHGDKKGNIWIGTNNGIDKVSFDSYGQINRIKNYKSKQGFKGVECNSRAIFEDKKNNLWIGTVKGLVKYDPTQDKTNVFEPNININNIKLFFEDINWLNYSKELIKWNNLPENLVLDYDENHLTFEFSAVNLTFPEDIQYKFKLTPFDENWFNSTDQTYATYSNLPPGKYTFNVRARNEDGVWNQQPASYDFTIISPWFKRWWVILIITLIIFYIIFKISSFKEKQQLKISRELEVKVKERTKLIESQRDEKEILLKEIHHRVKNNMQVIISLLSIQSGYTKDEAALALFDEAKNRIRSMALIHEKMYQTGDLAHIDFQDYIMALTNDLIDTYSINCDIFLDIKIDKVKFGIDTLIPLGLLLNEIISNALKYAFSDTNKGIVVINLTIDDNKDSYTLIVGDNGSGMEKGILEKEEGSLGMELIKIFVNQLEGKIERIDKKGTFFEINFNPQI
jgi:ligand-binding sensor domain-containing protein/two-component sensor histidine kinase